MRTIAQSLLVLTIALVLPLMFASNAYAVLIASDGFESYTPGGLDGLNGGTGFLGAWDVRNDRAAEVTVVNGGLSYSGGAITVNGGSQAMQYAATDDAIFDALVSRAISTQTGPVYMSFLYQPTNTGVNDFIQLGLDDGAPNNPLVSALDRNGLYQVRSNTGSTADSGLPSTTGQTVFMVLAANKTGSTYNDIKLYVNPTAAAEGSNTPSAATTANSTLEFAMNAVIRSAFHDPGDVMIYDEVRFGTTFSDVTQPVAPFVPAGPVDTSGPMLTLDAVADAYVRDAGDANNNFGSATELQVKWNTDNNNNRKAYFKFDISGVTEMPTDAQLSLTLSNGFGNEGGASWNFEVLGLNDGDSGNSWDEGTITWNNAPANLAEIGLDSDRVTSLGLFSPTVVDSGEGMTLMMNGASITEFINDDTDGLVTFIVRRREQQPDGNNTIVHEIHSRETSNGIAPELKLSFAAPVPEPVSATLLGLAGLALLRRRRRGA